jgi:hypothetical protein
MSDFDRADVVRDAVLSTELLPWLSSDQSLESLGEATARRSQVVPKRVSNREREHGYVVGAPCMHSPPQLVAALGANL